MSKKTTQIAVDVIYGDYGSGKTRVQKLKKKGYDPVKVQNEVNRLLKDSKKKSIDTLAHEVIDGYWRSGKKREKVLKLCGCDYNAIQNRVNEILNPQPTPGPQPYPGVMPSLKLVKTPDEVKTDAMKFARWIVNDERFGYGRMGGSKYKGTKEYSITHSGGCHFCGTVKTKINKAKKAGLSNPEEWEYTMVCNVFVHSCYAHAGVPSMLSAPNHAWWTESYQKSKYWTEIKKPAKITDLQPGDVLGWDEHFCLYLGNGKGAEATSGTGGGNPASSKSAWAKSIRITDFSKHFKAAKHVFRLTGSVNTTALIKYGEVSARVGYLQAYINWFYRKEVVATDGEFGDATLAWVKQLQKDLGVAQDGIVGNDTLNAMKGVVR